MKTTFVIGAGASCEFGGLEAGDGLKVAIARDLDLGNDDYLVSNERAPGDEQLLACLRALARSEGFQHYGHYAEPARHINAALVAARSIDNFLDSHRENERLVLTGKLAIATAILKAERNSKLWVNRRNDQFLTLAAVRSTWINALFGLLSERCPVGAFLSRLEDVSFVIFNYDRAVEHYFEQALIVFYKLSESDARNAVKRLNIVHPYGRVGALPGMTSNSSEIATAFGLLPGQAQGLLSIALNLKTFTEGVQSQEHDRIKNIISAADRLVFLGFAFHPVNMELLDPKGNNKPKAVLATGKGLSVNDASIISLDLQRRFSQGDPVIALDKSCNEFFYEYARSLSFM